MRSCLSLSLSRSLSYLKLFKSTNNLNFTLWERQSKHQFHATRKKTSCTTERDKLKGEKAEIKVNKNSTELTLEITLFASRMCSRARRHAWVCVHAFDDLCEVVTSSVAAQRWQHVELRLVCLLSEFFFLRITQKCVCSFHFYDVQAPIIAHCTATKTSCDKLRKTGVCPTLCIWLYNKTRHVCECVSHTMIKWNEKRILNPDLTEPVSAKLYYYYLLFVYHRFCCLLVARRLRAIELWLFWLRVRFV